MAERDDWGTDQGLPRWTRGRLAMLGPMTLWLLLLLAEPIAQTTALHPAWPSWLGLAVVAAAFLGCAVVGTAVSEIQMSLTRQPSLGWAARLGPGLLVVLTVATVALVARSQDSANLFSLLSIAVVIVLDAQAALRAVVIVTCLSWFTVRLSGGTSDRLSATVIVTLLSGLGCWSFRRLFAVIAELAATREELARVAVERERERFSRDLHDLLGHTLSVIVVKAQAVRRLATRDGEAAAQHGADIETIGRRALSEVRQAVDGYRGTGLAAELERGGQALAATGIAMTLDQPPSSERLPADVDALFGWVVREGLTNVVRHSGAHHCVLTWSRDAHTARIEIVDDGKGLAGNQSGHDGNGLSGLGKRVSVAGGRLEAGRAEDGFRLSVEVPVTEPAPQLKPMPDTQAGAAR
jgi:two-component system sensor histidine kinase DesK